MKLLEIVEQWRQDAKFDDLNLDAESLRTPSLHAKYLGWLSDTRVLKRTSDINRKRLIADLNTYYLGQADDELLKRLGRQQYQGRLTRAAASKEASHDQLVIELEEAVTEADEKIEVLGEVLKAVNNRNFAVKNAIDWRRLVLGG